MVSVELDGFLLPIQGEGEDVVARRVIAFAHAKLVNVRELWVTLSSNREISELMLAGKQYAQVDELRIATKTGGIPSTSCVVSKAAAYTGLSAISLDARSMTPALAAELVGRSQATLRELNIDEYTAALGTALQLHPSSSSSLLEFPQLRQLAISSSDTDYTQPMIDGARLPALEMLYFRETAYPPAHGNRVFASAAVRLMPGVWRRLRLLVVDALSSGDIAVIGTQAPNLKVLRVGLLGCDVDVPEPITVPPVPAMDIPAVLAVLQSCTQLVDFSVETPDAFEDAYNNHDHADPLIPCGFGGEQCGGRAKDADAERMGADVRPAAGAVPRLACADFIRGQS